MNKKELKRRKKSGYKYNGLQRYNRTYDFRKFKTIRDFGNDIRTNFINMYTTNNEQSQLGKYIEEFKSMTRPL